MLDPAPLVILTSDETEGREIHRSLGLHEDGAFTATPDDAETFITSSRLGGMIVCRSCDTNAVRPLVRAYIQHQPCGRIAVLVSDADVMTLATYVFLGQRVEAFFAPWPAEEIRRFLGLPAATPAGSAP